MEHNFAPAKGMEDQPRAAMIAAFKHFDLVRNSAVLDSDRIAAKAHASALRDALLQSGIEPNCPLLTDDMALAIYG